MSLTCLKPKDEDDDDDDGDDDDEDDDGDYDCFISFWRVLNLREGPN